MREQYSSARQSLDNYFNSIKEDDFNRQLFYNVLMAIHSPDVTEISLLDLKKPKSLPSKIALPASDLLAHTWEQLILETDQTGLERGFLRSFHKGKFLDSRVTIGAKEHWSPSFIPHGIGSWKYLVGMEDALTVHFHPMSSELNHIQTTHHSEQDLDSADKSWVSIVIDRGGAHLLTHHSNKPSNFSPKAMLSAAYDGNDHVQNVIISLAESITPYGFQYFYTPEIKHSETGIVMFTDARFLKRKVKPV